MRPLSDLPDLQCATCSRRYAVADLAWHCECGGILDVAGPASVLADESLNDRPASMWRYADVLPIDADPSVTLQEGCTPLVASPLAGVQFKLDFLTPTLSFKDRGAVVLATLAKRLGVAAAIIDSSGNAGTATAAYMARAGVACTVLVPASTSAGKLAQIRAHGANVQLVPGSRADTAAAALVLADQPGQLYASHVYHPYFLHGVKTYGYEIWEQSGRTLPDTVVVPVGNGTLLLGCYLAFTELAAAGHADRLPTLVGVQAAGCAPLATAIMTGASNPVTVDAQPTIAEGIAITAPARGAQILHAVRATGGTIVTVTDQQTQDARDELAHLGLFVEPTSAVCWAAVRTTPSVRAARMVVPLCGAGLKSPESQPH